jgi:NADPH:quinone reductase-like Zn-dependent oxidoreductase
MFRSDDGPDVTGVTSTRKIALVRSLGADHVVDYRMTGFTRTGRRYDLILDTIGNRSVSDLRRPWIAASVAICSIR